MALAKVRDATVADAEAMAALQLEVWRGAYAAFLPPEVVDSVDRETARLAWAQAIEAGGDAHLVVATEGGEITGFAAGEGAEVVMLLVSPRWGRRGHGGRLLGTLATRLGAGGAQRAQVWVPDADVAGRAFYPRHGWGADGNARTSERGAHVLREVRYSGPTDLQFV